jgi:hypothetical protein
MHTTTKAMVTLVLTGEERQTLLDVLEEALKETEVELHRTEAFGAKAVVGSKEALIASVLRKAREARPLQ